MRDLVPSEAAPDFPGSGPRQKEKWWPLLMKWWKEEWYEAPGSSVSFPWEWSVGPQNVAKRAPATSFPPKFKGADHPHDHFSSHLHTNSVILYTTLCKGFSMTLKTIRSSISHHKKIELLDELTYDAILAWKRFDHTFSIFSFPCVSLKDL